MSDEPDGPNGTRRGWRPWLWRAPWIILALLVLYPVSAGPEHWLYSSGHLDEQIIRIYEPLDENLIESVSETLNDVYLWWINLNLNL
jgi:hypothetical protein